jgi:hypothetical protein
MKREPSVEQMLTDILTEFKLHVHLHNNYSKGNSSPIPDPTIGNEILPMLSDRWASSGPGQHWKEIKHRLKPALQLASLFLTQNHALLWFSHFTFGERRLNSQGQRFIVNTAYSESPEVLSIVKANLRELGQVITFMFEPSGQHDKACGRTHHDRRKIDFIHKFRDSDFPRALSSESKAARVCIVMSRRFTKFYRKIHPVEASVREKYSAWIIFTGTLLHSIAHAYNYWLHGLVHEPLWDLNEKRAELGYSWESHIFGRVMDPLRINDEDFRFRYLTSIRVEEYATRDIREKFAAGFTLGSTAVLTERDVNGKHRKWPRVDLHEVRGARLSLSEGATAVIACIHAIPMRWIVNWFQQDVWEQWQINWAKYKRHMPPQLDDAFMVLYDQNPDRVRMWRPSINSFRRTRRYFMSMRRTSTG